MDAIDQAIVEEERSRKADRYSFVEGSLPGAFLLALDGKILPGICSMSIQYDGKGVQRTMVQVYIETFADYEAARGNR